MNSDANIPVINVGIFTRPEIHFVLNGIFHSTAAAGELSGAYIARLSGNTITIEQAGVVLGAASEMMIEPENAACTFVLLDVTIGVQFHWERKEDQRFVGGLNLMRDEIAITAVNVVNVEDYLTSVISSEMSPNCSPSLLRAHTITARSWLLAQLEKTRDLKSSGKKYQTFFETETERTRWYDREDHALFDVCADDHCQRYQGVTKAYTHVVQQAVRDTSGMVILYQGKVCDARFSKSCGGVMEVFESAWEPVAHPYLAPIVDTPSQSTDYSLDFSSEENADHWIRTSPEAFCNTTDGAIIKKILPGFDQETTDFYRWKVEYTQDQLADIVYRRSGIDFGQIVDLIPIARGASSRLTKLKIVGTKKTMKIGKELEIRRTLSHSHLYSSAIVVDTVDRVNGIPQKFVLHGAGWGHGVGLCQIGAAVMGERGYSHQEILSHYFPHTEIRKIY